MMQKLILSLVLLLASVPALAQNAPTTHPGKVRIVSTADDSLAVGCSGVSPASCTGGVFAGKFIFEAATTSGIRLEVDGGVFAIREGDDSAYAPFRGLSLGVGAAPSTFGITIGTGTPGVTTAALYTPDGTSLWFGATQLATGASVSGSLNKVGKFTAATTIGDSSITDNGTTVSTALPIATTSVAADSLDIGGGVNAGSGNVALVGTDGKINGPLSSTIIDDLSGANLTNLPAGQLTGSVDNARLDSDLAAIGNLAPTNDDIIQRKAGAWTNRTMANLAADLVPGGDASGTVAALVVTDDSHAHTGTTINALDTADVTTGTWADARVAQSNVTQHQAALSIAETQIPDGTLLARLAADETVVGSWLFSADTRVYRAAAVTTGYLFFGSSGSNYFGYDGSGFAFNGSIAASIGTFTLSQDAATRITVSNTNAGTNANASLKLSSDGGDSYVYRTSAAYATAAVQDDLVIQEAGGGDIVLFGAAEVARFANGGGVNVGTTAFPSSIIGATSGRVVASATGGSAILGMHDDTAVAANTGPGGLWFIGRTNDTGPAFSTLGYIVSRKENATQNNSAGYMAFFTTPAGVSGTSPVEAMRLASTGLLTAANGVTVTAGPVTMTADNVILGSNYLSGDGGDEGISVGSTGDVTVYDGNLKIDSRASTAQLMFSANSSAVTWEIYAEDPAGNGDLRFRYDETTEFFRLDQNSVAIITSVPTYSTALGDFATFAVNGAPGDTGTTCTVFTSGLCTTATDVPLSVLIAQGVDARLFDVWSELAFLRAEIVRLGGGYRR